MFAGSEKNITPNRREEPIAILWRYSNLIKLIRPLHKPLNSAASTQLEFKIFDQVIRKAATKNRGGFQLSKHPRLVRRGCGIS
jgi:hypothetical protein